MAKPWREVESSEAYLTLSPQDQMEAKKEYFDTVVAVKPEFINLSTEDKIGARTEFFGSSLGLGRSKMGVGRAMLEATGLSDIVNPVQRMMGEDARTASGMASGLSLGLARPTINKLTGVDIGEGNLPGRLIGGLATGSMVKNAVQSGAKTFLPNAAAKIASLFGEGAAVGAGSQSEAEFNEYLKNAPVRAGIAGLGNVALGAAASGISKLKQPVRDLTNESSRIDLFNQFRKAAYAKKGEAVAKFGDELAALESKFPDRAIDASESISDLQTMAQADPRIDNFIKNIPKLKSILDEGKDLTSLGLKEVQDIQNYIQGKLPKGVYAGSNHPLSSIADFLTDLKGDKLKAFPELAKANAEYAPIAQSFKAIKGKLGPDALESFIRGDFRNTEIKNAVNTLFGKNSDVLKRAVNFRRASDVSKGVGATSKTALALGSLKAFYDFLNKK